VKKTNYWILIFVFILCGIGIKNSLMAIKSHNFKFEPIKNGQIIEYGPGKSFIESIGFYKNGKLNGQYKEFYPDGQLQDEMGYKDGQKNGLYKEYYENVNSIEKTFVNGLSAGRIEEEVAYLNGLPTGRIEEEVVYLNGKKEGIDKCYNQNGILTLEQNYKNGLIEGVEKLFGDDGKLMFETSYRAGKKNGIMKVYDNHGNLKAAETMENDVENGSDKQYYPNGELKQEGFNQNGKLEGIAKVYYKDGKLQDEGNFKNDKKEGIWKKYDEDGTLNAETSWHDGKNNGLCKIYKDVPIFDGLLQNIYKNAKLRLEINYKDNTMIGLKYYDEKNNVILEIYYPDEITEKHMIYVPYNFDTHESLSVPALFMEENIKNDKREGKTIVYYSDGYVAAEWNYHNGKPDGVTKIFYHSTVVHFADTYKDGVKINRKAYDEEGKLKFDQNY